MEECMEERSVCCLLDTKACTSVMKYVNTLPLITFKTDMYSSVNFAFLSREKYVITTMFTLMPMLFLSLKEKYVINAMFTLMSTSFFD